MTWNIAALKMIRKNTAFLRQVVNQNENGNVAMWQHGTHRGCYFMKLGWSIRLPKSSVKREKKMFRVWFENAYFFTRKKGQTSSTWKKILKLLRKKTDAHIKNSTKKSGVTSDRNVYWIFSTPNSPNLENHPMTWIRGWWPFDSNFIP